MGRESKKFFSSSVIKKKSVTRETFLIDDETPEGGSDNVSPVLVYDTVTSSSFLNFICTSTSCFVNAHTGIAKLGFLKK